MISNTSTPEPQEKRQPTRILVPVDGSDLAAKAIPVAEQVCQQLSAELDLVLALPPLILPYIGGGPYVPGDAYQQMYTDRRVSGEQYLASAASPVRKQNVPTKTYIVDGEPAAVILDTANELGTSLIVMTTHGRTGVTRFALGSVADRVVRGAAAPVLLIRSAAAESPEQAVPAFAHALIPLDGSTQAETPLFSFVPQLVGSVIRTITLLRVSDPRDGEMGRGLCANYLGAVRQRLIDRLAGQDCAVDTTAVSGVNPAASIVERSEADGCDLVLMATHGEAGIGRWAMGSVTDRVLRDGKKPLLLVHPPRG
jgi:nucleotide-binding universal stress UspA family protein